MIITDFQCLLEGSKVKNALNPLLLMAMSYRNQSVDAQWKSIG